MKQSVKICCALTIPGIVLSIVTLALFATIDDNADEIKSIKDNNHSNVNEDDDMAQSALRRILCFGDSLTAGFHNYGHSFAPYGSFLQEKLGSDVKVDWIGYSGWTTQQMIDRAEGEEGELRDAVGRKWPGLITVLKRDKVDLAIVMGGTNDLGHGLDPATIGQNLIQLYGMAMEHNVTRIVAVGIPDSGYQAHNPSAKERRNQVNKILRDYAAKSNGTVTYVDCPVTYKSGTPNFEPDGLHFSVNGYKELANFLYSEGLVDV